MSNNGYTGLLRAGEADVLRTMGSACAFSRKGAGYAMGMGVATGATSMLSYLIGGAELHLKLKLTVPLSMFTPDYLPQPGDRVTVAGESYHLIQASRDALEGNLHCLLAQ